MFTLVLCYRPKPWDSWGMFIPERHAFVFRFRPKSHAEPSLFQFYRKTRTFFLHYYSPSSKYLTKTSKYPASSVKEDESSPSPIRGSFRLIHPHRYFVKLQILDKELWIHP